MLACFILCGVSSVDFGRCEIERVQGQQLRNSAVLHFYRCAPAFFAGAAVSRKFAHPCSSFNLCVIREANLEVND